MLNTEQQEDINNIYKDLLFIAKDLDNIRKSLNSMAMAIRPLVIKDEPKDLPWDA